MAVPALKPLGMTLHASKNSEKGFQCLIMKRWKGSNKGARVASCGLKAYNNSCRRKGIKISFKSAMEWGILGKEFIISSFHNWMKSWYGNALHSAPTISSLSFFKPEIDFLSSGCFLSISRRIFALVREMNN